MDSWKIVIIPLKTDRDVKGVTMLPVSINVAGLFPPDISCCRAKIRLPPGNGYRSIVCPKESKAAGQTENSRVAGRTDARERKTEAPILRLRVAFIVATEGGNETKKEKSERTVGWLVY